MSSACERSSVIWPLNAIETAVGLDSSTSMAGSSNSFPSASCSSAPFGASASALTRVSFRSCRVPDGAAKVDLSGCPCDPERIGGVVVECGRRIRPLIPREPDGGGLHVVAALRQSALLAPLWRGQLEQRHVRREELEHGAVDGHHQRDPG